MPASKRIGVIGAGAVGSILAAHVARTGREVVLIESGERREQVARHGLCVGGITTVAPQRPVLLASVDDLAGTTLEALFICTKTWSLPTLLPALAKVLDPDAVIVSFQNGIGPEEELAAVFGRSRVCRGIVNFAGGVSADGAAVAMSWFTPPNYLGPLDPSDDRAGALVQLLTDSGLAAALITAHEVKQQVFWKTILNAALSPLCASTGITMRQAMTLAHTRSLAQLLIREGLSVAAAVGYDYGESSLDDGLRYLDRGGDHMPSMWVDLQRGQRTEIEYINGKIVQLGQMFRHVTVDANRFVAALIVTLEIKSGARAPAEIPDYLTHS